MTFKTVLRDGQQYSQDMVQRMIAASQAPLADCPLVGGIGTGFVAGVVGKMNGAVGAAPNHFSTSAVGGTTLNLTVTGGWAWLVRDSGSSTFDPRVIFTEIDASQTITLATNSQGSTRVDTIALRIDMTVAPDATGSNLPTIVVVQGGASSAVGNAPADSALYLALANVTVANGATNLTNANIADKRFVHPSQAVLSCHDTTSVASIANNTNTQVTNLSADLDKAGMFATNAWTCPLPGWYRMTGALNASATAAVGINFCWPYLNGNLATIAKLASTTPNNTAGTESTLAAILQLAYGDVVRWGFSSNPGVGQTSTIIGGSGFQTYFDVAFNNF